jgi:hypothetical protein
VSETWTEHRFADNFVRGVQVGANSWADIKIYEAGVYGTATGFVYFVGIGDPYITHVKIGFTRKNPFARMASLQTGCPFKMKMLGYVFGNEAMEAELHDVASDFRAEGEWFEYSEYVSRLVDGALNDEWLQ